MSAEWTVTDGAPDPGLTTFEVRCDHGRVTSAVVPTPLRREPGYDLAVAATVAAEQRRSCGACDAAARLCETSGEPDRAH